MLALSTCGKVWCNLFAASLTDGALSYNSTKENLEANSLGLSLLKAPFLFLSATLRRLLYSGRLFCMYDNFTSLWASSKKHRVK